MSNAIGATPDTKYYLRFTDASGQVYSTDGGSLFAVTNVQFGASNPAARLRPVAQAPAG